MRTTASCCRWKHAVRASLAVLLLLPISATAQWTVSEGTAISPDVAADERVAFDLLGQLWILPTRGSQAQRIDTNGLPVREPRFSRDDNAVLFQTRVGGAPGAAIVRLDTGDIQVLRGAPSVDAVWRPNKRQITLASGPQGQSDLYNHHLDSGQRLQLTDLDGAESDPAWSFDGRDLAYIHENNGRYRLMLRRAGHDDEVLIDAEQRLSSPSWRPDGSLLSYIRHGDELEARMLIFAEPALDRELLAENDLFDSPIAWVDRQRMVYAANGAIRRRDFNSWIPRDAPFRATIEPPVEPLPVQRPALPEFETRERRWTLRVAQVLSPDGDRFLPDREVVIDGGRIVEIRSAQGDEGVLDIGDAWLVPGLIDASACLPSDTPASLGPLLLSFGITALVADQNNAELLNDTWAGAGMPGPIVLPPAHLGPVSELADGNRVLAANVEQALEERWSPAGRQYDDAALSRRENQYTYLSGQNTAAGAGGNDLLSLGQAAMLTGPFRSTPVASAASLPPRASVIIGSGCNAQPPGVATVADVQLLIDSGRPLPTVLAAATRDAADALDLPAGRIDVGQLADFILLGTSPLSDRGAYARVIAVVRNGRLHSVSGLLDKANVDKVYN